MRGSAAGRLQGRTGSRRWFVMASLTRVRLRSMSALALAAGAAVLLSVHVGADGPVEPVLNALQVRDLVDSADPAAHARLEMHFATLANAYANEAARQRAIAAALPGNPNHWTGATLQMGRLARRNAVTATTLRQLAAHHARLADGRASRPPADAERFEDGEGATPPTRSELAAFSTGIRTHYGRRMLRHYFLALAREYEAGAQTHRRMASS